MPQPGHHDNQSAASGYSRHSHGLEQFFGHIDNESRLSILDLAGITQANVTFITGLGHRLYSEDFLRSLPDDLAGSDEESLATQAGRARIDRFINQSLGFPDEFFDGVLVWDILEFLSPPLLKKTVERLFRIAKPGSHLLAFFHAEEKAASIPVYSYRIIDSKTLFLIPQGMRSPVQLFNNRGIERLFQQFRSVKFFLARDHLREVIVTR